MSTLFIKIKHDVNGNPRHVTSWLGYGFKTYEQALECAKTIGGKKFNNKQFGGGIVFQSYDGELKSIIDRLTVLAKGVNPSRFAFLISARMSFANCIIKD